MRTILTTCLVRTASASSAIVTLARRVHSPMYGGLGACAWSPTRCSTASTAVNGARFMSS